MKMFAPGPNWADALDPSVFLAGPSPRKDNAWSWRPTAQELFQHFGFDGQLYIPEPFCGNYKEQIEWEEYHLKYAKCIMFWIPRDMNHLPGLTTNIEWGVWQKSGKVVLGTPHYADSVRYIKYYADKYGVPQSDSLAGTVKLAIQMVSK